MKRERAEEKIMSIIDNAEQFLEIESGLRTIGQEREDTLIKEPFTKDFALRFCWSSNAIEGNTLDLEETVSVIEYDEVRSGHTYTEYQDTKNLYRAISTMMIPFQKRDITADWLKNANGILRGIESDYRTNQVYIGTLVEAVFYPPDAEAVAGLMEQLLAEMQNKGRTVQAVMEQTALQHIQFEQIHPFRDGNGRVGRMVLNQQLINYGFLPIIIEPKGKYRQAFRQFEKNKDLSLMTHILCKGELDAIQSMQCLIQKRKQPLECSKESARAPGI